MPIIPVHVPHSTGWHCHRSDAYGGGPCGFAIPPPQRLRVCSLLWLPLPSSRSANPQDPPPFESSAPLLPIRHAGHSESAEWRLRVLVTPGTSAQQQVFYCHSKANRPTIAESRWVASEPWFKNRHISIDSD